MALTVFAKVTLPIELAFLIVSYVILGGDVVWQAVRNISKGLSLIHIYHMQYQIRDPEGFARMLETIMETDRLPKLTFAI